MKIDRIRIDGFGEYAETSLAPLARPVTLFYGPNEAGKSTLLAFIRMVLFGFPLRGAAEHYPPRAGGAHGGRIEFVSDGDARYTFERHHGRKGGPLTITTADGALVPEAARPALLGHATASTFTSVFAFDLDGLRQLESADDSGISSRIYSAGTGAANLPRALKELKTRADEIYAPRGSKQPVAKLLGELHAVETQLRQALSQAQEYGEAVSRCAALENEGAALREERARIRARVDELRRRQDAWDAWVALRDVETRMADIPERADFPDDPIVRLSGLEDRLREADEQVAAAAAELARARDLAERPVEGEALLQADAAVEALRRGRGGFDASVRDLPKRESELAASTAELAGALRDLGPGWDEARLTAFDSSIPRRDEVEQWTARLASAREDLRDRTRDAEQASQALDEVRQRLQVRQDHLDRCPAGGTAPAALPDRRAALQIARSRLDALERAEQRCRDFDAQAGAASEPTTSWRRFAMPVALGALGALLLVAGVLSDGGMALPAVGVVLIVLAAIAYTLTPSSVQPDAGRSLRRLIEDARRQAGDRRVALQAALAALALDLPADQAPGRDQLQAVETALLRDEELHRDRAQRQTAVDEAATEVERAQERSRAAQRRRETQQTAVETATAEWAAWLARQGLPDTLAPDTVPELFSRVDTARVIARTAGEKRQRIAAIRKDIDAYRAAVQTLAAGYPGAAPTGDESTAAVAQRADRIVARFDETKEAVRARAEAVRAADKRAASLEQAISRRTGIADRVRDLLSLVQTDDPEEFRRLARQHLQRQELERQCKEHASTLRAAWAHKRDLDALRGVLGSTTKEEIDEGFRSETAELAGLERRVTGQDEERGRLRLRMQQLSGDEDASRLRGRRAELVEAVRRLAAEWSTLVVARSLLVKARHRYEEERQPDVVRRAETFFRSLTGGRYTRLHVTVGEQEITVVDETGRRKTPAQLSRGTREQLYLALRFGLIRSMGEETERLPVVVDEVLVNFDLDRARRAAAAFVELSRSNQVLVLTCHQWIVELFSSAAPDAAVVDLSAVPAAP